MDVEAEIEEALDLNANALICVKNDSDKIKPLNFCNSKTSDFEDEDVFYPLSLRYNNMKAMRNVRSKYIIIALMIILSIFLATSLTPTRSLPNRIGYFADKVTKESISLSALSEINDAYPNIIFKHPHEVTTLTVTGSYWAWTFEKMKIKTMVFTITVGSLNVVQNRVYAENKVTLKTPHGTHCVAGNTINTVDANWPSQATRDAGISGTFIDTSTYCTSELYVCSDSSAIACPGSGTAASATQGDFTITLDDGPVQLLIDGSANGATSTYAPTQDTFSISSQILLSDNKNDFSSDNKDSRIYIYEVISPGYTKLWTHSSLKQYIQARPW
jgi:hypothetical protein